MLLRLAAAAAAALASGAAFRLHVDQGVPALRMLATILLVVTGLLLTSALERWQVAAGLSELERRLGQAVGVRWLVLPKSRARRARMERLYVGIGPAGLLMVGACSLSEAAWPALARSHLAARARALGHELRHLRQALAARAGMAAGAGAAAAAGAGGVPSEGAGGQLPVPASYGMIVLLRRRLRPAERELVRSHHVGLAAVEQLPRAVAFLGSREQLATPQGQGGRWEPAAAAQLADEVRTALQASPLSPASVAAAGAVPVVSAKG